MGFTRDLSGLAVCLRCGYVLHASPAAGRCSECGLAVPEAGDVWLASDRLWWRLRCIVSAVASGIALIAAYWHIGYGSSKLGLPETRRWEIGCTLIVFGVCMAIWCCRQLAQRRQYLAITSDGVIMGRIGQVATCRIASWSEIDDESRLGVYALPNWIAHRLHSDGWFYWIDYRIVRAIHTALVRHLSERDVSGTLRAAHEQRIG